MRRILLTAFASSLLAFALPAAASAHHSARHHSAHRAGAHRRHKRAHTVVFAAGSVTSTPGTTTPKTTETPPSSSEPAGTIASYENGVLKITLADGSTVTGKVTENTEIECGCPGHDGFSGDGNPGWQHDGQGSQGPGDFHGDDEQGESGEQTEKTCGVASLVAGAKVKEAELVVSSAGAVWEKVELAQ